MNHLLDVNGKSYLVQLSDDDEVQLFDRKPFGWALIGTASWSCETLINAAPYAAWSPAVFDAVEFTLRAAAQAVA